MFGKKRKKRKIRKTGKSLFNKTYDKREEFHMIEDIAEAISKIYNTVEGGKVSISITHLVEENKSLESDKSLKTIK